jgi:hypothetical protein
MADAQQTTSNQPARRPSRSASINATAPRPGVQLLQLPGGHRGHRLGQVDPNGQASWWKNPTWS